MYYKRDIYYEANVERPSKYCQRQRANLLATFAPIFYL